MTTYYAIKYWDTPETTRVDQHPITGKRSIACNVYEFSTFEERKKWLSHDPYFKKRKVNKKELRKHFLGMPVYDYEEMLSNLELSDGEL
jgi:hypothetical protein